MDLDSGMPFDRPTLDETIQDRDPEWRIHALSLEWREQRGGRETTPPSRHQEQPLVDPQLAQR
jgi:hypothetical protein